MEKDSIHVLSVSASQHIRTTSETEIKGPWSLQLIHWGYLFHGTMQYLTISLSSHCPVGPYWLTESLQIGSHMFVCQYEVFLNVKY